MPNSSIVYSSAKEEYKYFDIPEVIYHYTSPTGLIGIVSNNELWFSRFDCLNDTGEGAFILEIYKRTIGNLNGSIDSEFLDRIKNVKPDYHKYLKLKNSPIIKSGDSEGYYVLPVNTVPYLCCFSRNDDSLPMWNYYSKNGQYEGYNIGFRKEQIIHGQENIKVIRCIYNEEDQIAILKVHIMEAFENFTKHQHSIDEVRSRLASAMSTRGIQFKNPVYEHEDEIRLVFWRPDDGTYVEVGKPELKYRQTHGIIIPYLKWNIDLKETIASVKIGPLIQKDVAETTIRDILMEKGLSPIITQSNVPIRY